MNHPKKISCLVLALSFLVSTGGSVAAQDDGGFNREYLKIQDRLLLQSGALLQGVIAAVPEDKLEPVSFESATGDTMLIDRKLISKIEKVDAVSQRYNDAIATMKDDAQSHRDMIAWCEEQERGRTRFRSQIMFHLKRIIFFEPNDRSARTKLGYTFLKDDKRWVSEAQFWGTQGYAKQGAKWNSLLHNQAEKQLDDRGDTLAVKRKKFGLWKKNLRRMSHREAVDNLVAIADPQLMPHLLNEFKDSNDKGLRAVYAEAFALARPTTSQAALGLVGAVMEDGSDIALDFLLQEDFNRKQVAGYLAVFLRSKNNREVRRAGYALGQLNSENAILALAEALETKHVVTPARQDSGATRTQGNAGGDSFQFGGNEAVSRVFQNEEVRGALQSITGEDYGFSKEAYQQWYVRNYTHVGLKARR